MTPDEIRDLGVWDPDAPGAAERLALIRYLIDLGATADDLRDFADDLPGLPAVLAFRGGRERITRAEVAARSGLSEAFVMQVHRATGFADPGPDDRVWSAEHVDALQTIRAAEDIFGPDAVAHLVRVVGSSMARIADAIVAAFHVNVGVSLDDGAERARTNAEVSALVPALIRAMDVILRQHLIAARRPPRTGSSDGWTQPLAVGFADLVGSTALAQELTVHELNEALASFEQRAADAVTAHGGRVVKLIGDEVMFAFTDPKAACDVALELTETFSVDTLLPPVRVGVAWGEVLSRDGDHYGPVVNLAARIVKLARPGTVLVSRELAEAGADGHRTLPLAPRRLRGFDARVPLAVLRRA